MPRNITVKFGDGSEHVYQNAPDDLTPEQVSSRAAQEFGKQVVGLDGGKKPPERGMLEGAWDSLKNVGTGLAKGAAGLATLAGDAMADDPQVRLGTAVAEQRYGLPKGSRQPQVGDVSRMVAPMGYQPKTPTERIVQSLSAGAGGALSGPGAVLAPVKAGMTGLGAAAASELAGEATNHNPLATILAGVLGGGLTGVATNMRGNAPALAREALRDTKPEDLAKAKAAMMAAQSAGIPVNLSQAMSKPSNIDTIVDTLANSRYGTKVTKQLHDQPTQVAFGMEDQMLNLPGAVRAPQVVANNAQEVATQVIGNAKKDRSAAWKQALDTGNADLKAQAQARVDAAARQQTVMQERFAQAQALEQAKQPPTAQPAVPTGVGATQGGILLDDAGRGRAAINAIDTNDGKTALAQGQSAIVGADGKPLVTPPQAGSIEPYANELSAANVGVADAKKALQTVGELPESELSGAYNRLTREAAARPNTGLGAAILELRDKLTNGNAGFITGVEQLNNILKDTTNKLKAPDLATKGIDAGDAKYLGSLVSDLREGWGQKFAPFREANSAYAQATNEVVNPLKKSVVGEIAGRRGALPDVEAVKTKLSNVFNQGTVPGAKSSEILTLEKQFRGIPETEASVSGSAAYQDAVKTWMAQKVSDASRMQGGRVDPNVAGRLEQSFLGTDTKAQGFKDMLVGLARSQGKPDATYVEGMQKFLKIASMAGRRPGSVQGISQSGAAEIAGRTVANAGGSTTVNPLRNLMLRWSERLQADAYKEMDRLLTSPEGVDMLQKLAKKPAMSPAAQTAVSTFLGSNAARSDDPPPDYEQ